MDIPETNLPGFNPSFKIQGKLHHKLGSLLPCEGDVPKFAQLYFPDTDHELQNRLLHMDGLDEQFLEILQYTLRSINSYCSSLKSALEMWDATKNVRSILDANKKPTNEHCRRFNLPMSSEVLALIPPNRLIIWTSYSIKTMVRIIASAACMDRTIPYITYSCSLMERTGGTKPCFTAM